MFIDRTDWQAEKDTKTGQKHAGADDQTPGALTNSRPRATSACVRQLSTSPATVLTRRFHTVTPASSTLMRRIQTNDRRSFHQSQSTRERLRTFFEVHTLRQRPIATLKAHVGTCRLARQVVVCEEGSPLHRFALQLHPSTRGPGMHAGCACSFGWYFFRMSKNVCEPKALQLPLPFPQTIDLVVKQASRPWTHAATRLSRCSAKTRRQPTV